jgi:hypothetical protein
VKLLELHRQLFVLTALLVLTVGCLKLRHLAFVLTALPVLTVKLLELHRQTLA